ncbi:pentatricopeptide repeat-containing protein At1g50270 [Dendrobium catenatum]|uniref:Pentatricopeptide repeat-containing protein n=1 Tax=Dendrobium catenatum TaxID=906689 RepID=A0A2I0XIR0_9ASPA|nr:pentatricopeptide repeat-containing protein At1g50270 [Dendrobium catenatum]PKU87790.1 Pentatricopeptide repeat-containing protein [Dendrobium catenatum]
MLAKLPTLISRALLELRSPTTLSFLKQIHAVLITASFCCDAKVLGRILRSAALSLPGDINYASLLFHRIECPDISLWNNMIQGYSLRCQYDAAVSQFIEMLQNGLTPNEHTFPVLLKSLSNSGSANPIQIHAQIFKLGLEADSFVQNSLLWCYVKGCFLDSARKLFDEMPQRDAISWNAMVQVHVKNHFPELGLDYFIEMRSSCAVIDEMIIVSVLNGSSMDGNIWLGRSIQAFYVESGRVKRDVFVGSALVDMYMKCGCCFDARKAFDEMPFRNVVSWTSLISGYVQCNRFKEALSIFRSMLVDGPNPNQLTLSSIFIACAHLGALEQGRWVHSYVDRIGMELNSVVGSALIDMYAKCGQIDDAFSVFHRLPNKDVYSWTALINGLALHGLGIECLHLFSQMLQQGVKPNDITFLGVLGACCHGGLVHEGKIYFDRMLKVYGIKPKLEHYGCMVDLLGRAGHLEEALCFIESMPKEPSISIWGALFGACMIHRDFVLGEKVGKHIVAMKPEQSSGYLLLASLYSVSKRWKEAARMRMAMRVRKVEKVAGCSWLELNGVLHEFLASDGSHAQAEGIYETLLGITLLMNLEEYGSGDDTLCLLGWEMGWQSDYLVP